MKTFAEFGFLDSINKTLKEKSLYKPTEIQAMAIPMLLGGQSVVGVSETGSGKTLAYALPVIAKLKELERQGQAITKEACPRALVLVPTRELGDQVARVFKSFTHDTRLRVRAALGGMKLEQARRNTAGCFEVLLATPGRLTEMLQRRLIDLSDVRVFIIDEADQMLDAGFLPDAKSIAKACPKDLQMALFSATVSKNVEDLISTMFADAEVIRSQGSGRVVKSLITKNLQVIDGKRWPLFEKLLKEKINNGTMIFANTREQVDKIATELKANGFECAIYRGEMEKNERRQNLKKFREGKIDLLVSTDLAGRGLDLEAVGSVINYHLPQQMDNYLHRVGRTARAGRSGLVVNLVTERDSRLMGQLQGNRPGK